jgi:hypothetical protein
MDIARSDAVPAGAIPAVADIPGVRDRRLQTVGRLISPRALRLAADLIQAATRQLSR